MKAISVLFRVLTNPLFWGSISILYLSFAVVNMLITQPLLDENWRLIGENWNLINTGDTTLFNQNIAVIQGNLNKIHFITDIGYKLLWTMWLIPLVLFYYLEWGVGE